MLRFALAAVAAAFFVLPVSAGPIVAPTDVSAQPRIEIGPGGVRIGHERWQSRRRDRLVHDRWESRRRDRLVHNRWESRGPGRPGCRTVTIRERVPGYGVRVIRRRSC